MALHVAHNLNAADTARNACQGWIQGFACRKPSVDESVLEAQVAAILEQFTLPDDYREQPPQRFALTTQQQAEALHLLREGVSIRDVAKRYGVSHSAMWRLAHRDLDDSR